MQEQRTTIENVELPERVPGEKNGWYARFLLFLHMGPNRKPLTALHLYQEQENRRLVEAQKSPKKLAKALTGAWKKQIEQYNWIERAQKYDELCYKRDEAVYEAERKAILAKRYALMHKRVELLDDVAEQLNQMRHDEDKVWLLDVKSIGSGPGAERVDLVNFNDALFEQLRKYLADIASEMGERVKTTKQEVTGKDGGPVETENVQTVFYVPKVKPLEDEDKESDEG